MQSLKPIKCASLVHKDWILWKWYTMQAGDVFKLMRAREHLMTFPTRNLLPKLDNMLIILFADFPSMANSPIHYFPWEEI